MTTLVNANDPRVKRTRQLLFEAFVALLEERHNIHSISVQDIAERATVNRATFYAHFEDKYALIELWLREKFHRALVSQLPTTDTLQMNNLRPLIQAVFDFFARFRQNFKPADKQYEPFFQMALQQELYELLLIWLKPDPAKIGVEGETIENIALVISWAIFGPAVQWSRGDLAVSTQEMTERVMRVVCTGLSPVLALSQPAL